MIVKLIKTFDEFNWVWLLFGNIKSVAFSNTNSLNV